MEELFPDAALVDALLSDELDPQRLAQGLRLRAQLRQGVVEDVVPADVQVEVDPLDHAHQAEAPEQVVDDLVVLHELGLGLQHLDLGSRGEHPGVVQVHELRVQSVGQLFLALVVLFGDVVHVQVVGNGLVDELPDADFRRVGGSVRLVEVVQGLYGEPELRLGVLLLGQPYHQNCDRVRELFHDRAELLWRQRFEVADLRDQSGGSGLTRTSLCEATRPNKNSMNSGRFVRTPSRSSSKRNWWQNNTARYLQMYFARSFQLAGSSSSCFLFSSSMLPLIMFV